MNQNLLRREWSTASTLLRSARDRASFQNLFFGSAVGVGIFGLILVITRLAPVKTAESRDWVWYLTLVTGFPLGLGAALRWEGARRFFLSAALVCLGFILYDGWAQYGTSMAAGLRGTAFGKSLSSGIGFLLVGLACAAIALLNFTLIARSARWIGKPGFFGGPGSSVFSPVDALIAVMIVFLVSGLSENDRVFFFLGQRYGTAYLLLPLVAWICHRAFKQAALVSETRPLGTGDMLWFLLYLTLCRLPAHFTTDSQIHHWSYYVGPVESVKAGGWLLADVPSQYGFLSILLPSLYPGRALEAFGAVFVAVLLVQIGITYGIFRSSRFFRGSRFFPGLLTLACVFFVGASHMNTFGVLETPSVSGYRFLWAFALAVCLTSRKLSTRLLWQTVLSTVLFSVGCLWSSESAVYCIATLGCALVGDLLARNGKTFLLRSLGALGGLIVSVAAVEMFYRAQHGSRPDWFAFIEYALAYQGGFGAIPIFGGGAFTFLIAIITVVGAVLVLPLERREKFSGGRFAVWGFMMGTLTYYISRSHPNNICNLLAYWLPLLCVLVEGSDLDATNTARLRVFLYPATVILFLVTFGNLNQFSLRADELAKLPQVGSIGHAFATGQANKVPPALMAAFDKKSPAIDLTDILPALSVSTDLYQPLYPAYPISAFLILKGERQVEYLERAFSKSLPPRLQVLRLENDRATRPIISTLLRHYRRDEVRAAGGVALDTYVAR